MEFGLTIAEEKYTINHLTTNLMSGRLNRYVQMHKHPVFHILYILEGKGTIKVGSASATLEPGKLFVISPNEPHSFLFGDGEQLSNLESTFQLLDGNDEAAELNFFDMIDVEQSGLHAELHGASPIIVPPRLHLLLKEGFERILDLYNRPNLRKHFSIMVADLMARVETVALSMMRSEDAIDPDEERIERIKQYLHANRERSVTLQQIADHVHLSPNYLCRVFKECTGETPMGYLRKVRMYEAKKLLSLTDLPVYTIAEKLGYDEPSYFSRIFHGVFGESPHMYRKRLQTQER